MASSDDNYWPEEIITQILLKCPAKTLVRFRSVCKSWTTLIHNPNTISNTILFNANNKNINTTNSQLLVSHLNKITNPNHKNPPVFSLFSYHNLHQMSATQELPLINSPDRESQRVDLVDSRNGIVCLHDHYGDNFLLWNPATGEVKVLPPSQFSYANGNGRNVYPEIILFGFEFFAESKDYKVINLLGISMGTCYIEMYSRGEDYWKRIEVEGMGIVDIFRNSSMVVNGTLSWFAVNRQNNEESIFSFDMEKEVFQKTRVPTNINRFCWFIWFYRLNDCLAVFVSQGSTRRVNDRWWFDVWVLLEIGVEESWCRLYRLDPVPELFWSWYPLGFWKEGKVFLDNGKGKMVVYDLDTHQISDHDKLPVEGVYRSLKMVTYEESKAKLP